MKTRGHSSTVQATKKLTNFNQMIISFMAVAFLILFSANVTIYLFQPQQSSKSISSDRFRSDGNNNPQLFKHSDNPPSFEDLLKFQHEQLQQQQQHSESTKKTFEFSEEHLAIPSTRTHVEGEDIGHVPEVFGGDAIHEVGNEEAFSTLPVTLLPAFTNEFSEFIFNSLIEIANEKKTKYYLTLQLLSHYNLRPAEAKRLKILKSHRELWQNALNQFHSTKYFPNGKRREKPFIYCRISYPKWNPSTLRWYEAEEMILADFVPNRLSSNPAVNKRIDIMTENSGQEFQNYYNTNIANRSDLLHLSNVKANLQNSFEERQSLLNQAKDLMSILNAHVDNVVEQKEIEAVKEVHRIVNEVYDLKDRK